MTGPVRSLGEYIREQRASSQISLRQLATLAGVSNPYLSQIERGLRKPSAEILQQIAKGLRISAEALYVQAGILDVREHSGVVVDALMADEALNERQKQVLLEIYDSFRKENAAVALSDAAARTLADVEPDGEQRPAPTPRPTRRTPTATGRPAPTPRRSRAAPRPPGGTPGSTADSPPHSTRDSTPDSTPDSPGGTA